MKNKKISSVRSAPPRFHDSCDEGCIVIEFEDSTVYLYDIPCGMIDALAYTKRETTLTYHEFRDISQENLGEDPEERLIDKGKNLSKEELLET